MAGNPNPKGSKPDKLMRDAIMVALNREVAGADGQPTKKLYQIADALVDLAVGGDMQAIKEVNDRADGRAIQAIAATSEITHRYVAVMSELSPDMDTWQKQHGLPLKNQTVQ